MCAVPRDFCALSEPLGPVDCGGDSALPSFPFSLPIVASMMSHAGGSSVVCVCARACACTRLPAARAAAAAVSVAGRGNGSGHGVGELQVCRFRQTNQLLKVKSHWKYSRPRYLDLAELIDWLMLPRAPPPCLWGPETGQVMDSAGW